MRKRSRLVFDSNAAQKDLIKVLVNISNEIISRFFYESTEGLDGDFDLEEAKIKSRNLIASKVVFYAEAIMDSFGTGSLMDKNNPYLQEYIASGQWNPERNDTIIVGRPEGEYENIFGETVTSGGFMAGVNIEGFANVKPPKYTIQNAEKWLLKEDGYIKRYLEIELTNFIGTMGKYFRNVR